MSDKKFTEDQIDNTRQVVITPEDARSALDFWKHFEIPIYPPLQAAVDRFCEEPTLENQEEIKYNMCKAIAETEHEAFSDEMFAHIRRESAAVSYDIEFDRQLEKTLSEGEKSKT